MDWLSEKYCNLLSSRVRNFKHISDTYAFSCDICGDSKKHKRKARANIYSHEGETRFHCYNCQTSQKFYNYLKGQHPDLFREYNLERMQELRKEREAPEQQVKEIIKKNSQAIRDRHSRDLAPIEGLARHDEKPELMEFLVSRQIPKEHHSRFFWAEQFGNWVNKAIDPERFTRDIPSTRLPRIVIPYWNENGDIHCIAGRSLEKDAVTRYLTIKPRWSEDQRRIYGLDLCDPRKTVYALEGQIDALFIPNAIAFSGGDHTSLKGFLTPNTVIIYDNEPKSSHTQKKVLKAIYDGLKVVIWPKDLRQKDINDMILSGLSQKKVMKIIQDHTFAGPAAIATFRRWSNT